MRCVHNGNWTLTDLPHGIFAARLRGLAIEYHEAAESLFGENSHRSPPAYFCAANSIELSLKSYLGGCGLTRSEMRKAGHCLECLYTMAIKHGLCMREYNYADVVRHLREYTTLNRYPDFSMDQVIAPHDVLITSSTLLQATESVVIGRLLDDSAGREEYEIDVFSHGIEIEK